MADVVANDNELIDFKMKPISEKEIQEFIEAAIAKAEERGPKPYVDQSGFSRASTR